MATKIPYMVRTEDGYLFTPLGKGEWGDGDGGWCSYREMLDSLEDQEIKYKVYHVII